MKPSRGVDTGLRTISLKLRCNFMQTAC